MATEVCIRCGEVTEKGKPCFSCGPQLSGRVTWRGHELIVRRGTTIGNRRDYAMERRLKAQGIR